MTNSKETELKPARYVWINAMSSQGRLGRLYDGEPGVVVLEGPDGGFVYGSLESGHLIAASLNTRSPDTAGSALAILADDWAQLLKDKEELVAALEGMLDVGWDGGRADGGYSPEEEWAIEQGKTLLARLSPQEPDNSDYFKGPGDWPEDANSDNGCYENKCCECEKSFTGNKHRVLCKTCSNLLKPAPQEPTGDEQS